MPRCQKNKIVKDVWPSVISQKSEGHEMAIKILVKVAGGKRVPPLKDCPTCHGTGREGNLPCICTIVHYEGAEEMIFGKENVLDFFDTEGE